jgi:uncharacterized membrane protein YhaH (DUF805 family)
MPEDSPLTPMDRDLRPATTPAPARNPYLIALGVIGAIGVVVGVIAYLVAANAQPDSLTGAAGAGVPLAVGNIFTVLGGVALFLWLTAAAITWRRD